MVLVVMHATLADCPGGGFETEADQAKCDGSVRSIPVEVLSTEILAPLTGVCWRFGMKKLHVRTRAQAVAKVNAEATGRPFPDSRR